MECAGTANLHLFKCEASGRSPASHNDPALTALLASMGHGDYVRTYHLLHRTIAPATIHENLRGTP